MADLSSYSVGMNAETGAILTGWDHVLQSLNVIFTTNFGERVMREWFGSAVPAILGQNLDEPTVMRYFSAVASAIDVWEPRVRVKRFVPRSVGRDGKFRLEMVLEYRPRALTGDFTVEGARTVGLAGDAGALIIERTAA